MKNLHKDDLVNSLIWLIFGFNNFRLIASNWLIKSVFRPITVDTSEVSNNNICYFYERIQIYFKTYGK